MESVLTRVANKTDIILICRDTQKCLIYILITALSFSFVLCFNHINKIN